MTSSQPARPSHNGPSLLTPASRVASRRAAPNAEYVSNHTASPHPPIVRVTGFWILAVRVICWHFV